MQILTNPYQGTYLHPAYTILVHSTWTPNWACEVVKVYLWSTMTELLENIRIGITIDPNCNLIKHNSYGIANNLEN